MELLPNPPSDCSEHNHWNRALRDFWCHIITTLGSISYKRIFSDWHFLSIFISLSPGLSVPLPTSIPPPKDPPLSSHSRYVCFSTMKEKRMVIKVGELVISSNELPAVVWQFARMWTQSILTWSDNTLVKNGVSGWAREATPLYLAPSLPTVIKVGKVIRQMKGPCTRAPGRGANLFGRLQSAWSPRRQSRVAASQSILAMLRDDAARRLFAAAVVGLVIAVES